MSSRCHCAAGITAKFIDVVTKLDGGQRSVLMRWAWANVLVQVRSVNVMRVSRWSWC